MARDAAKSGKRVLNFYLHHKHISRKDTADRLSLLSVV